MARHAVRQAKLARHAVAQAKLGRHAVAQAKLARRAVSRAKIADGAVSLNRLSVGVREQLAQHTPGATGATGPPGPAGPAGPPGADAPAAGQIRFDAAAVGSPTLVTVLDIPALQLRATCTLSGGDVTLDLHAQTPQDTLLQNTYSIDSGADPANPPQPGDPGFFAANGQNSLPANADTDLTGPSTNGGTGYFRVIATAVAVSQSTTISLILVELVNADTGRCRIDGTAVPAI